MKKKYIAVLCSNALVFGTLVYFLNTDHLKAQIPPGKGYQEIVLNPDYDHTKWGVEPADIVYHFAAYTTSFDSDDDNNEDGVGECWGIPEWVAYEVKVETDEGPGNYNRPKWLTDDKLYKEGKAPNDATYAVSGTRALKEVAGDYRYVRGHMCPKNAADRIGMEAGYNTHTVLNAVPQLQWQNNGIWKYLEEQVNEWADEYGSVWVICGPVFFGKTPAVWLGQEGEVKAAVPDALYKIVIRETEEGIKTLGFIFPNVIPKEKDDFEEYLTSIDRIENLTGLRFLTVLEEDKQLLEKQKNVDLDLSEKKQVVNAW